MAENKDKWVTINGKHFKVGADGKANLGKLGKLDKVTNQQTKKKRV